MGYSGADIIMVMPGYTNIDSIMPEPNPSSIYRGSQSES
jgi:hypothetical protein